MRTSICFLGFFFCLAKISAQDDIIIKKTGKSFDYEVKILEIKNDTVYYKSFGKTKYIYINDILCYCRDSDTKDSKRIYIYPDTTYKQIGKVYHGKFTDKKRIPSEILKPYKVQKPDSIITQNRSFLLEMKRTKLEKKIHYQGNRKMRFRLEVDSGHFIYNAKLVAISKDTVFVFICGRKGEGGFTKSYYAFGTNDFYMLGLQTKGALVARYSLILIGLPIPYLGWKLFVFRGPIYKYFYFAHDKFILSIVENMKNNF